MAPADITLEVTTIFVVREDANLTKLALERSGIGGFQTHLYSYEDIKPYVWCKVQPMRYEDACTESRIYTLAGCGMGSTLGFSCHPFLNVEGTSDFVRLDSHYEIKAFVFHAEAGAGTGAARQAP